MKVDRQAVVNLIVDTLATLIVDPLTGYTNSNEGFNGKIHQCKLQWRKPWQSSMANLKKDTMTGYFRSQHKVGYKDYKQAVRQVTLTVTNFLQE